MNHKDAETEENLVKDGRVCETGTLFKKEKEEAMKSTEEEKEDEEQEEEK
jgi:hypothetical protein